MRDLLIHDDDLIVATHGRSFWVMDDIAPLRELAAASGKAPAMLLKPAAAWRVRRSEYTDTPMPPDEPAGENPPDGACLDYTLAQDANAVTLEILDAKGTLVRRYASDDPVTPSAEDLRTNLIPAYWPQIHGPLPVSAGMHRWVWNLRATQPMATSYEYPISAVPHRTPLTPQGPLVLPGVYTVKLTVDGRSETQKLTVKMDPRVHTPVADLDALHAAQVRMAASLDELAKADLAAHSVQEQMSAPENASLATQLAPFVAALKKVVSGNEAKGAEESPGLDDVAGDAATLYGNLQQSDNPPTQAVTTAAAHTREEGEEALRAWREFQAKQLPAIDAVLRQAGRPAIDIKRAPKNMPQGGDED
jgi:hypothetical protein